MNIFAISGLVNGIVAITFGILVISKNCRDRANQIFFFMTLSLAVWAFSYWQWLLSTNYDAAILWVRILSIGSLFIPVFFYHWVILLINGKTGINKIVLWLAYITAVIILFFARSNLFIAGLEKKSSFIFWPNPGSVYDVYFSYVYVGLITYTLYLLLRAYPKELDQNKRGQLLYVILGAALGFGGGLTNFPLWWNVNIPPYGNFLVAAFPFLLGYSVLKYKLFNAKTITAELIAFALWAFTLIITFLAESTLLRLVYGFFSILMGIGGVILIKAVYKTENLAKKLGVANERLKELDALKTEFISFATHQLRAPITAIKGYTSEILEGDFGSVPDNLKSPAEVIMESSSSLAVLVDDYLNVSRIEQGKMKYEFSDFNLGDLVNEVANEQRPSVEKKGLKLEVKVDGGPPGGEAGAQIHADRGKIKQVIINLLDNAVKYTPAGQIIIALAKQDGKARLSVRDTGAGIKPETMSHLFQKFSRASDASKYNLFGTGLGLYLASELLKAHHGKIWAESPGENNGSTFFVELSVK